VIKASAVSSAKRNPALPEEPTFAEQGFPTIDDVASIILWLKSDVLGGGATPQEMTKTLRAAYEKQGATLRSLGVKPQDLGG
jgi:tripartite-type tricarboxylate transporter receptor subunit TctC